MVAPKLNRQPIPKTPVFFNTTHIQIVLCAFSFPVRSFRSTDRAPDPDPERKQSFKLNSAWGENALLEKRFCWTLKKCSCVQRCGTPLILVTTQRRGVCVKRLFVFASSWCCFLQECFYAALSPSIAFCTCASTLARPACARRAACFPCHTNVSTDHVPLTHLCLVYAPGRSLSHCDGFLNLCRRPQHVRLAPLEPRPELLLRAARPADGQAGACTRP